MVEYWGSWLKPPIRHSYRGYPILTPHFWRVCQICLAESTLWLFEIAMENQHFRWIIELNKPWLPVCKLLNYQKGYISLFCYISSIIPHPICFPKIFLRFSWENNNITMFFLGLWWPSRPCSRSAFCFLKAAPGIRDPGSTPIWSN